MLLKLNEYLIKWIYWKVSSWFLKMSERCLYSRK